MSGALFVLPTVTPVNGAGRPHPGALLYFYLAGTATPATVYTDASLTTPHQQPVEANSDGVFPSIWLDPTVNYASRMTTSGGVLLPQGTSDPYPGNPYGDLTQSAIGAILYPRTGLEQSAGLTVSSNAYTANDGYDVRRMGVVGNGVADDTTALRNAAKAAGPWGRVFIAPELNCLVSGPIVDATLSSYATGQTWYGGGKITTASGFNFNVFELDGITDFTVHGLRGVSGTLGASYSAATARFFSALSLAHRCKMLYCHVTGFQSAAQVRKSEHCQIIGNDIISPYGWGVNVQTDSATNTPAHDAIVAYNRISGVANEHGIYVSGTASGLIRAPLILGNIVTGSANDGIKTTYTTEARIIGNTSYSNGGQGVYITVGTSRSLVDANAVWLNGENGILVFDSSTTSDRNRVSNNTVRKNDKNGISVSSSGSGAVSRTIVENNDVEDNDQEATGTQYGIVVSGATTTTKTTIRFNRVTDETIGIRIASGVDAKVYNNEYENNTTNLSDAGTTTTFCPQSGSFTATLTGCTTSPTGTVKYSVNGDAVTLEIPAISATSNTTAATLTGMPADIYPVSTQNPVGFTTDNGTTAAGKLAIGTSGTITLHVGTSATFTNSGTKGIAACSVTYRRS